MKELTIIIPVYNAEKTIHRCVDSVLAQTIGHDSFDVILVDDCSTDRSFSILKEYESSFPGVISVLQTPENLRQGGARNLGMRASDSTYLGFVDADDWIEPVMYEHMLNKANTYSCDVVSCRYTRDKQYYMHDAGKLSTGKEDMGIIIEDDLQRSDLIVSNIIGNSLPVHLYRKDILIDHQIFSPEKVAYEDLFFDSLVYLYANRIYLLEENLYHYYINDSSTVLAMDAPYHRDFFDVMKLRWDEYKKRGALSKWKYACEFDFLMSFFIAGCKILSLRYSTPQIHAFRTLLEDTVSRIPDYAQNPYLATHATEFQRMQISMLGQALSDAEIESFLSLLKNAGSSS